MKVFTEPLEAIRSFYGAKGVYHTINAERTIEEIVDDMESFIKTKI